MVAMFGCATVIVVALAALMVVPHQIADVLTAIAERIRNGPRPNVGGGE